MRKLRVFPVAAIAVLFAMPTPKPSVADAVDAPELLTNGDFESAQSGWEPWHCKGPGAVGVIYSSSDDTCPGSTGKQSLQIDTTDAFACTNWIRRPVYGLKGGKKYQISTWYKIVAGGAPDGPVESVIASDRKNDTNQDRNDLYFDMKVDGKWKYVSGRFTAELSTTDDDFYRLMVSLVPRGKGGKGGIIRLDDFSLRELIPMPTEDIENVLAKLSTEGADPQGKKSRGVEAGILGGLPYLRNKKVIYLWSRPQNGGGLLRVQNLRSGKDLLATEETEATWWTMDLKRTGGQRFSYENTEVPCEVKFNAAGGEGKLLFTWPREDVQVQVETRLKNDESLTRSRITIEASGEDRGLLAVTFPVIKGIVPLTDAAQGDQILTTHHVGDVKESPLVSGKRWGFKYPLGAMQFTALLGDGRRSLLCRGRRAGQSEVFRLDTRCREWNAGLFYCASCAELGSEGTGA